MNKTKYQGNVDKLIHMLNMQKMYDDKVMREKHLDDISSDASRCALLDEVGELNHELKKLWCWWKDSQGCPDREKVLEELIDCWHFVMNRYLRFVDPNEPTPFIKTAVQCYCPTQTEIDIKKYARCMCGIVAGDEVSSFRDLIFLSEHLGFTFDELYDEYIKKNTINYQRLKNHY